MKTIFASIILVGFSFSAIAGEPINRNINLLSSQADGEKCYDEKTHIINVGIGLYSGYYAVSSGEKRTSCPSTASVPLAIRRSSIVTPFVNSLAI